MSGFSAVQRSITTAVLLLGTLTSCGGDSGDPTDPESKAGVSFSYSPTSLTLVPGQTGTVRVSVSRSSGLKGNLALSYTGPSDVTATFDPASLPEGTSASTLTLVASATANLGTTPVFVEATLNGARVNINGDPSAMSLTVIPRPSVTIAKSGSGAGTVTSSPAGINCGGICTGAFNLEPVTLTAAPAAGSAFVSWAGNRCSGTSLTCTFTPVANNSNSVTATFNSTTPAITVSISPSPATVQAGSSTTATLTVTRINGFANPVALTVNAPNGLTVSPNPASVTETTSTLTITAASSLGAGNYPVTITAAGTGVTQQSLTLAVQVTPSPNGGAITYNYTGCEAVQIPVWLAVQNGTGSWTRVTPTNNAFTFAIATTGAIAMVTRDGSSFETIVFYASAAEIAAVAIAGPCRGPATGTKRVIGTFGNAGNVSQFTSKVMIGGAEFTRPNDVTQGFTLTNVPSGARDLIATRNQFVNQSLSRMILRRGTNYNNNATIPLVDFGNVTESFAPKFGAITITNAGTDSLMLDASLLTTNGASAAYYSTAGVPTSGRTPYFGLPDSLIREGDFHGITIVAVSPGSTAFRFIQSIQRSPAEKSTAFGPQLGTATKVTTLGATPYLRLRAEIPTQATYTSGASAEYSQGDNAVGVFVTAAYLASPPTTTWTLDLPDFSGTGYDAAWALKSGTAISWEVAAMSGNVLPLIGGLPVDNAQITGAGAQSPAATFNASRWPSPARRPRP